MTEDLIRLLLRPVAVREAQAGPPKFDASREDTGKHVVRSHQPLYDGARVLLEGGTLPTTLLTTRHIGRSYDNYRPAPVGRLAGYVCEETKSQSLYRRAYRSPSFKP